MLVTCEPPLALVLDLVDRGRLDGAAAENPDRAGEALMRIARLRADLPGQEGGHA